ncbi:MAG: molecular chaperone DnaJ [Nitrosopumilus sp. H13]|nr:MAG: molecular chaperone DnaJ [Nitrosopumilus sp. H13]
MNTPQALKTLNIADGSSQEEIKTAYRRLALELHPDRKKDQKDNEFKKVTEAYNHLKRNGGHAKSRGSGAAQKPQWGAPKGETPEQDWSKYTHDLEQNSPEFWKEYEKKFWEDYNARVRPDGRNGEYEKAKEPPGQPDLFVSVDESLCIGCCSCEIMAPGVFRIDRESKSNPKSSVINQKGAGVNKIVNAARTCPTKAINVDDLTSKERLFPY